MHNQGLRQLFLTLSWDLLHAQHGTQGESRDLGLCAVLAQKDLEGSETEIRELLGGTEEKSTYLPIEGTLTKFKSTKILFTNFTKMKQEKNQVSGHT